MFCVETDTPTNHSMDPTGVQQLYLLRLNGWISRPKDQAKSLNMNSHKSQATQSRVHNSCPTPHTAFRKTFKPEGWRQHSPGIH